MILITGATQGIGYHCALAFLERTQFSIAITGRNGDRLERAKASLAPEHRARLVTRISDQSKPAEVDSLIEWLAEEREPIAGAILGVGVNPMYQQGPRRLEALDRETVESTIRTNCTHALLISTALLGRFRRQGSGVLIWIGSRAPRVGLRGAALYCATKSFLSGLAASAHNEYSARGIRLHLLHPGLVRTPRTAAVADRFGATHGIAVAEPCAVANRIVDRFLDPSTSDLSSVEADL
jgi:NAD(P)-dependent dehydrogenase (short-subunit alcohol dehydrogenase family)